MKKIKFYGKKKDLQSDAMSLIAMIALLGSAILELIGVLRTSSNSSVPSTLGRPWSSRIATSIVWRSVYGEKFTT